MTKLSQIRRCEWCHRPMGQLPAAGRPRRFCSASHRQRAYEARRRSETLGIPEGQVLVARGDLDKLHDGLYRLESALEDVEADLEVSSGPKAYREAFGHLREAAQDLVGISVEPVRV